MYLEIISPEFTLFSGEVTSVTVPGVNGEFEMLNNHVSIVSTLKKGIIKIYGDITIDETLKDKFQNGPEKGTYLSIDSGTVELKENKIIALVD
jgi:F-type H+-transporting ATPase subunit epsilon|tara:strand:+ start:298 stop:576 length:279 start_codon:yes stop_codon:yes gene_type:complete